jgi:alpha-ketoglutarate-dependent taurine dioxygenase
MTTIQLEEDHLVIQAGAGSTWRFHYMWLRDNCPCQECRVEATGERRVFTPDIPDGIAPRTAAADPDGTLTVEWHDGHRSEFAGAWLARHEYSDPAHHARHHEPTLWAAWMSARLPRFAHDAVVGTAAGQLAYLEALRDYGVAVVSGVPSIPGEVERFAETIGHVREVAFERVHNVRHDPKGYNVAHTPGELKPHTDLPSYHWPPSVQLLHCLKNRASGGESVVVDGWKVLDDLRRADPEGFRLLVTVPVTFQLFSDDEDTCATAPIVQLDPDGRVTTFRFSNQLALPLDAPFDVVGPFYRAYRTLGRMIDDARYKAVFKLAEGDLLTVHGHRVLHGRLPYDPASGARHLQDVYMEWDDLMARRRVLREEHKPMNARPAVAQ